MSAKGQPPPPDIATLPLEDDTEARQFVLRVNGHRARLEYDRSHDRIFLTGISVPRQLAGQNVGDTLIERVLFWVEENNLKLVPTHPEIKEYLKRNTDWQRLMLKGVQLR
jgi:predicted GNAT family acetyltransferase